MTTNKYLVTQQSPGGAITNITDGIRINEQEGILVSTDSFSFNVLGSSKYDNLFSDGDNIKIYFAKDNDAFQLVMDGFLKELDLNISIDKKVWSLIGQNRLEILLNAPIPAAYTSTGTYNTSPKIIQNLITIANGKWIRSKFSPIITATLKSNGGKIDDQTFTNFSKINYYRADMPVYQQIEELSLSDFTGEDPNTIGSYIYYIDSNNNFIWQRRPNTATSTINMGDFISAKIMKTLYDVINFAVIDAGPDFNGAPIKTYAYNATGLTSGFKGKYFVKNDLSNQYRQGVTNSTPFGTAAASGFADNQTFRNRVQADAHAWAQVVVNIFGMPRYKADIIMKGTTGFSKGSIYTVAIPGVFRDVNGNIASTLNLRLRQITHTFSSKGWITTLNLQQDEKTVTGTIVST